MLATSRLAGPGNFREATDRFLPDSYQSLWLHNTAAGGFQRVSQVSNTAPVHPNCRNDGNYRRGSVVARLLARPPLNSGCELVIDETGVGRAVGDLFDAHGMKPTRVTITAGDDTASVYGVT